MTNNKVSRNPRNIDSCVGAVTPFPPLHMSGATRGGLPLPLLNRRSSNPTVDRGKSVCPAQILEE